MAVVVVVRMKTESLSVSHVPILCSEKSNENNKIDVSAKHCPSVCVSENSHIVTYIFMLPCFY